MTTALRLALALTLLPAAGAAQAPDSVAPGTATSGAEAAEGADADAHLREGRWLFEFIAPDFGRDGTGGGAIGFWNMLSERTSLGTNLYISVNTRAGEMEEDSVTRRSEQTQVSLSLRPGVRRYFETRRAVAAYAEIGLALSAGGGVATSAYETSQWSVGLGVAAGVGLNWFVTDALSLSGGMGASLNYSHFEGENRDYEGRERTSTEETVSFNLRSWELRVGLWF